MRINFLLCFHFLLFSAHFSEVITFCGIYTHHHQMLPELSPTFVSAPTEYICQKFQSLHLIQPLPNPSRRPPGTLLMSQVDRNNSNIKTVTCCASLMETFWTLPPKSWSSSQSS